jgi:heterotetrameric sarcosine oxidase delta subunit
MSFTIVCPHCGPRPATEYGFLGEVSAAVTGATLDPLSEELYFNDNIAAVQLEWWFHRYGCERWLLARRDTRTNEVHEVWAADESEAPAAEADASETPAAEGTTP